MSGLLWSFEEDARSLDYESDGTRDETWDDIVVSRVEGSR